MKTLRSIREDLSETLRAQNQNNQIRGNVKSELNDKHQKWIASWLDAVQDGRATMSQRASLSVNAHGGLAEITKAARLRGIHLVELTDDKGRKLIAASRHPFKALC